MNQSVSKTPTFVFPSHQSASWDSILQLFFSPHVIVFRGDSDIMFEIANKLILLVKFCNGTNFHSPQQFLFDLNEKQKKFLLQICKSGKFEQQHVFEFYLQSNHWEDKDLDFFYEPFQGTNAYPFRFRFHTKPTVYFGKNNYYKELMSLNLSPLQMQKVAFDKKSIFSHPAIEFVFDAWTSNAYEMLPKHMHLQYIVDNIKNGYYRPSSIFIENLTNTNFFHIPVKNILQPISEFVSLTGRPIQRMRTQFTDIHYPEQNIIEFYSTLIPSGWIKEFHYQSTESEYNQTSIQILKKILKMHSYYNTDPYHIRFIHEESISKQFEFTFYPFIQIVEPEDQIIKSPNLHGIEILINKWDNAENRARKMAEEIFGSNWQFQWKMDMHHRNDEWSLISFLITRK